MYIFVHAYTHIYLHIHAHTYAYTKTHLNYTRPGLGSYLNDVSPEQNFGNHFSIWAGGQ